MTERVPPEELVALRERIEAAVRLTAGEQWFARAAPWLLLGGLVMIVVVSLGGAFYHDLAEAYRPLLAWVLTGSGTAGAVLLLIGFVGIGRSQRRAIARLRRARQTMLAGVPTERLVDALCIGMEGPSVEKVRADLLRQLGAPPSEAVPAGGQADDAPGLLTPAEPRPE